MLAKTDTPTASEIRAMIAKILASVFGGTEDRWWRLVGNVAALSLSTNLHSNWAVQPRGTAEERDMINRAVAVVREAYPNVSR